MFLKAEHVSKTFGSTIALDDVSLLMEKGKVHALVGENGAGKSTLFKIISGYVPCDKGSFSLDDTSFNPLHIRNKNNGIALVHQELNINSSIGIAENVFFGSMRDFANKLGYLDYPTMKKKAQALIDSMGASINVQQDIKDLNLGQLKILQVAQALAKKPKVLLLDESTAYLNVQEVQALLQVIANLKQSGLALGFVSHHLDEVNEIADTMTILKDGKFVGTFDKGQITQNEIESLMVGRDQIFSFREKENMQNEDIIFAVKSLTIPRKVDNVSFELHRHEILGFGGLKGAGGESVLKAIMALEKPLECSMEFQGKIFSPKTSYDATKDGISYLPGNRLEEGLIPDFSISDNIVLPKIPNNKGLLDKKKIQEETKRLQQMVLIKTDNLDNPCTSLSGGNMQKVVIAKCLISNPKIILLNNPTRGIDIGARHEIYHLIEKLAEEGLSFILLSEDLIELIGLSDRVLVFNKGKVKHEFNTTKGLTEKDVVSQMI